MSTNWKRLYGPIEAAGTSLVDIYTAPVQTSVVIGKCVISNSTAVAALATITMTPASGVAVAVFQRVVPGKPVQGGTMEVVELEGQTLNPGDKLSFTAGTATALSPWLSGVEFTP